MFIKFQKVSSRRQYEELGKEGEGEGRGVACRKQIYSVLEGEVGNVINTRNYAF